MDSTRSTAQHDVRPLGGVFLPHVHDSHAGERTVQHAPWQRQQLILAGQGVVVAFHRRRGRAQHHQRVLAAGAHDRHVAAVVARGFVLLVRGVVLLVHDHEPQPGQRREHGRARADHDVHFAPPDAVPLVVALARRQPAVLDGDAVPEHVAQERRHRRRQRDLRDHQQHLTPRLADQLGDPEVDLGLAAAGHAVEQRHMKAGGNTIGQGADGCRLFRCQLALLVARCRRRGGVGKGVALDLVVAPGHQAQGHQAGDDVARGAALTQLPLVEAAGRRHQVQRGPLLLRQAAVGDARAPTVPAPWPRPPAAS